MNRNRLLLIGVVALALGALVSFGVYENLQSKNARNTQPGSDVVVAANDIQVGAKLSDGDVKVVHFPDGSLPPNAYRAKSEVVGRGVVLPISKGEFVLPSKIAGENAGYGLPGLIPPGMRAMSVRVNEVVSVAGFVLPGTRVDVLLTGNPTGANEQQTTTVLENVAVIAVGPHLERNSSGEPQSVPVITLLVSPDDAQRLTLASTEGRIQLVLRNPLDTRQQDLNSVGTNSLYRRTSAPVPVSVAPKVRAKRTTVEAPPAPTVYSIEVIRGNKKDETKF
jgi:pilus assembly protein CpaB